MPNCARLQFQSVAFGFVALALLAAQPATGQAAPDGKVGVSGTEIRIDGPITQDVADNFIQQIRTQSGLKTVSLNSPGGRVFPALDIARAINSAGLNTAVPNGDECYSACSFIFLAGRERIADGFLGVHQVSGIDDPSLTQSAIGDIYEELVGFNTPSYLVSRMLRTPPEGMYIFSPEELERHSINIRDFASQAGQVPHLLPLETWMRQDWLVGAFMNTQINKPFIAIESRGMDVLMRIAHYPHRQHTFIEFMLPDGALSGTTSRIELRFGHSNDEPFSLYVDADIESNAYAFDMPQDPDQARVFWTAFTAATDLTVLNGYGVQIGRFSLDGSRRAFEDFLAMSRL